MKGDNCNMAMINKSVVFQNATIDKDNMVIYEDTKNGELIYKIDDILSDWNDIPGITLTIKQKNELPMNGE